MSDKMTMAQYSNSLLTLAASMPRGPERRKIYRKRIDFDRANIIASGGCYQAAGWHCDTDIYADGSVRGFSKTYRYINWLDAEEACFEKKEFCTKF